LKQATLVWQEERWHWHRSTPRRALDRNLVLPIHGVNSSACHDLTGA
jgi:hypothetical protein